LEVVPGKQIYDAPIVGKHRFVNLGTVPEYDSGANQTVMNLSEVFGESLEGQGTLAALNSAGLPFVQGRHREI
jgi:hypothetical protein